jgi:hypothetical protein
MRGASLYRLSEICRMSFNTSIGAAIIGTGTGLAVLMAYLSPALSQSPPPDMQAAGGASAQDDHSYLRPSMRSQIESAKTGIPPKTEAQVNMAAKRASVRRRLVHRRVRRESAEYVWPGGRGFGFFRN